MPVSVQLILVGDVEQAAFLEVRRQQLHADRQAIDETGWPTPLRVPDPRAFALHKAWLASRPDRDAIKKPRDLAQARAVAALVREHMPHLPFSEAISSLHGDVRGLIDML